MASISELKHGCDALPLQIRILRKWIPHYRDYETWFLAVDKNGDAIGILGENAGQKFLQSKLHLSKCYKIERYSCSETPRHQRILNNPTNLNVGSASKITEIEDKDELPKAWFYFVSTQSLHSFTHAPEYYPDFVGKFSKKSSSTKRNGDPLLYLTLTDHTGQEVIATLWKECIENQEKFNHSLMSTVKPGAIIAITNVKPTVYGGRMRIASTDATHVILNPPVSPQILAIEHTPLSTKSMTLIPANPSMTIDELLNKTHSYLLGKTICVESRIRDFDFEDSWYMSTCDKCKTRIPKQGKTWFCVSDGSIECPVFYFSLHAFLDDGTQSMKAMLTDAVMKKMTGTTCEKLVLIDGYDERKIIPTEIEQQKTKRQKLCIEMTKKSSPNKINFVVVDLLEEHKTIDPNEPAATTQTHILSITSPATTPTSTPPPPTTDSPQNPVPQTTTTQTPVQTSAAKHLTYETSDDIDTINPSKRRRYKD